MPLAKCEGMRGARRTAVPALALLLACCGRPGQPRQAAPVTSVAHPSVYRTASATGALVGYDARTHLLTLRSAEGVSVFRVADDARVWQGSRRVGTADLARALGADATVAFAELPEGPPVTHTVRLMESASPRASR